MTYYELLEVSESASQEVITMAYRTLSIKYHPDRFKGDPEFAKAHWKRLNTAYLVLCDPEQRKQYDEFLLLKRSKGQVVQSKETTENSDPKESEQKKEKALPSFKRSAITVGILLPMAFLLELLLYMYKEYSIGYALFVAFTDFILFTFSYMLIPLLIGAFKKRCSSAFIANMSWINSVIVMILWNVITDSSLGEGWMLMAIYTFVCNHVVIQMRQKIQQRNTRILVAGVSLLVLAIILVCGIFGLYVVKNNRSVPENATVYYIGDVHLQTKKTSTYFMYEDGTTRKINYTAYYMDENGNLMKIDE